MAFYPVPGTFAQSGNLVNSYNMGAIPGLLGHIQPSCCFNMAQNYGGPFRACAFGVWPAYWQFMIYVFKLYAHQCSITNELQCNLI